MLSLACIYYDGRLHAFDRVKWVFGTVMYPFQYSINLPERWFNWANESIASYHDLQVQNTHLQAEIFLLKAQLQKFTALERENASLRELLLSVPNQKEHLQVTELIAINQEPFVQEFIINQGGHFGVHIGQPVLSANGLLGQVISINPLTSKVLLITDSRSAVPVEDSQTHVRGILIGTGQPDNLRLINIPATATINPGDLLVTSGLDERFPAGYPVGRIVQIAKVSGADFDNISVKPTTDMNRVRLMLLVSKSKT